MSRTQLNDHQLKGQHLQALDKDVLALKRQLARLTAVSELKDRVDGASKLFYDLFDGENQGSVAKLDTWESEVGALEAGATSLVIEGNGEMTLQAGMEVTVQSKLSPEMSERVIVSSITSETDSETGSTSCTLALATALANSYSAGAIVYRSKGYVSGGAFLVGSGESNTSEFCATALAPNDAPSSATYSIAFSPNGRYLAVAHLSSPIISIFVREGNTFTKLSKPISLSSSGTLSDVVFSPDSSYLALAFSESPYIMVYKIENDKFTKLKNPSSLPLAGVNSVTYSSDGKYLAMSCPTAYPCIITYKQEGDTLTRLTFSGYLAAPATGVKISPDGNYMAALIGDTSPYLYVFKRTEDSDGESFNKRVTLSAAPSSSTYDAAFSPCGKYLAVATLVGVQVYHIDEDGTFTRSSVLTDDLGTYWGRGVRFSPDGRYLAVIHNKSPYISLYRRQGDSFIKEAHAKTIPHYVPSNRTIAFSPSGDLLAVGFASSPYLQIYTTGLTPAMKNIDVRYNITSAEPVTDLAAWVDVESETSTGLDVAVSIHEDQENYLATEMKASMLDDVHQEHQATISTNASGRKATLRITAAQDHTAIHKITGAIG